MEGYSTTSLLNKDYEKVLDLIAKPFRSRSDVVKRYKEVNHLTWELLSDEPKLSTKIMDGFNFIWHAMPKEAFEVDTIEKLNLRINQFAKYVVSVENEYKDHGFSLLVTYYLKVCSIFLDSDMQNGI